MRENWKDLKFTFSKFDVDGSGTLNDAEMRNILFKFNIILEDRHFNLLMNKIDTDGDGTISYPGAAQAPSHQRARRRGSGPAARP